jgi:hypothetical protein
MITDQSFDGERMIDIIRFARRRWIGNRRAC